MFSGIVETTGVVSKIVTEGSNKHFTITSDIAVESYIDQSIAHNGVCLTVVDHNTESYVVTAIKESLIKTNLGNWHVGDSINLERSLTANARIDGHYVQGHVDGVSVCCKVELLEGSWYFYFKISPQDQKYIVNKGSICINGVSLTVVEAKEDYFSVAIIPYTFEHTNFKFLTPGDAVNLEFDILGKYIVKYMDTLALK